MAYAGNLTYPSKPILINNLTAQDLGVFTETQSGGSHKVLCFKKHGVMLPMISGKTSVTAQKATPGAYKGVLLELGNTCPCTECNLEYGIELIEKVSQPGVFNSTINGMGRFYGGNLDKVKECTNGIMDDDDVLEMEDTIITAITDDDGVGGERGAIANAYRAYRIRLTEQDISAANEPITFTYTSAAGAATAVTLNATTIAANINIINVQG